MNAVRVDGARERTFVLVFAAGDEAMGSLLEWAAAERIDAASVSGIGAFADVVLAYFDTTERSYVEIPVHEQVEAVLFTEDIALESDRPKFTCTPLSASGTAP